MAAEVDSLVPISARETKAVYNSRSKQLIISDNLQDLCKIKIRELEEEALAATCLKTQHPGKTRKRRVFQNNLKSRIIISKESQCRSHKDLVGVRWAVGSSTSRPTSRGIQRITQQFQTFKSQLHLRNLKAGLWEPKLNRSPRLR